MKSGEDIAVLLHLVAGRVGSRTPGSFQVYNDLRLWEENVVQPAVADRRSQKNLSLLPLSNQELITPCPSQDKNCQTPCPSQNKNW
jgi:hypothetical protein